MDKVTAEQMIKQVAQEYAVQTGYIGQDYEKRWYFSMDHMPVLPFFIALAKCFCVPIENIAVDCNASASNGCPTCGPDIELEIEVRIRPSSDG